MCIPWLLLLSGRADAEDEDGDGSGGHQGDGLGEGEGAPRVSANRDEGMGVVVSGLEGEGVVGDGVVLIKGQGGVIWGAPRPRPRRRCHPPSVHSPPSPSSSS